MQHSVTFCKKKCARLGILYLLQSQDIDENPDSDLSDFWTSGKSFISENCHNSRIGHDIDMTLGSVTERDKRNLKTSKKIGYDVITLNDDVIVFFWFMINLQPFGSRIPDRWSINFTFLLTITFYLSKPENKTLKSLAQLSYCYFE